MVAEAGFEPTRKFSLPGRRREVWRRKKQNWCRGPGTNGSRHPFHHQGRGINPSGAMRCALALCKPSSNQQGRPIFAEPAGGSIECRVPHISAPVGDTGAHREVGSRTIHGLLLRTNNQLRPPLCLHCGSLLYPKASQDGHQQTQKPGVIPAERGGRPPAS